MLSPPSCKENCGPITFVAILCALFLSGLYICFIPWFMQDPIPVKFHGLTKYLIEKKGMSAVGTWALFTVLKAQNVSVSFVKRKPKTETTLNKLEARAKTVIEGRSIWGLLDTRLKSETGYFITYKNDTQSLKDILQTRSLNTGGLNHNMFYQWIWRFFHNDKVIVCLETFKVGDCPGSKDLSQIYSRSDDMFVYNNARNSFNPRRVWEMEAY